MEEEELDVWAAVATLRPRIHWGAEPEVRTIDLPNREARLDDLTVEEEAYLARLKAAKLRQDSVMEKKKDAWITRPDPKPVVAIRKERLEPLTITDVINPALKESLYPAGHIGDLLNMMFAPYLSRIVSRKDVILQYPLDKFKKKFKITSNVLDPMIDMWNDGKRFILGGGKLIDFVNNKTLSESTNDYDIFHEDNNLRFDFGNKLIREYKYDQTTSLSYLSEYVSKLDSKYPALKVQNVHNVVACPEQLITSFDIRACAIACDGQNIYWVKGTLKDIRDKKIVMLHPRPIIGTFDRVIKYVQKGYSIAVPDLVIASIRLLDSTYKDRLETKTMRLLDRDYECDRSVGGDYLGFFGEEPQVL